MNFSPWLALVISLPGQSATPRMRIWRALKALGTVVVRDGVYLLPASEAGKNALATQAREVEQSGGSAYLVNWDVPDAQENARLIALFDRSADYARLLVAIEELKARLPDAGATPAIQRGLRQCRRDFAAIAAIDHFPGTAKGHAEQVLREVEASVAALVSPYEPQARAGEIARLAPADYQGRLWVTRARPWVDRLASAWLIKRFIDRQARFLWLREPGDCPREALGFDFDGGAFTHVGARVTFEVLLASFGLESDVALARLAAIVHYLDVGGMAPPEAAGLEALLRGARQRHADDDALLAQAQKIFDFLYAGVIEEQP